MDFGRLPDISAVDFSFPPEPAENAAILHTFGGKQPCAFYLGAPQWTDPEWPGLIYPRKMKAADTLKHYARQFNTVELNTTFYRIPNLQTVRNWKKAVPGAFRFCPKIPQLISHEQQLTGSETLLTAFLEAMRELEETLGTVFLQLPQTFGKDRIDVLKKFLDLFPDDLSLALEFRHASWFADSRYREAIFSFLQERHMSLVMTDTAGRRDVCHLRLTAPRTFIRFAANNGHPTDRLRLQHWASKIEGWKKEGLEEVYFFLHSPAHAKIPELSNLMAAELNDKAGAAIQLCVFIRDQQQELF